MAELLVGAAANSWLVGGARVASELQSVLLGGVARSAAVDAAAAGEAADAAPAQGRAAPDDDSAAKPSKRARTEPAAADDWVSTFLPGGASTLAKLSKARASLGDLSNHSFMRGRALANEYEALGGSAFVCRSALKLAALDAALALAIGCPTTAGGTFTFADLCGAPGGFTEYVLGVCTSRAAKCQGACGRHRNPPPGSPASAHQHVADLNCGASPRFDCSVPTAAPTPAKPRPPGGLRHPFPSRAPPPPPPRLRHLAPREQRSGHRDRVEAALGRRYARGRRPPVHHVQGRRRHGRHLQQSEPG